MKLKEVLEIFNNLFNKILSQDLSLEYSGYELKEYYDAIDNFKDLEIVKPLTDKDKVMLLDKLMVILKRVSLSHKYTQDDDGNYVLDTELTIQEKFDTELFKHLLKLLGFDIIERKE